MTHHEDTLPRGSLAAVAALVVFALGVTTLVTATGTAPSASPVLLRAEAKIAPVTSRSLRFADRADGAVVIKDAATGRIAKVIDAGGETGFIRGVMRGLARERRMLGVDAHPPFTLAAWQDGQLSLTDSATGRSIELTAFGPTNREAFAELLR